MGICNEESVSEGDMRQGYQILLWSEDLSGPVLLQECDTVILLTPLWLKVIGVRHTQQWFRTITATWEEDKFQMHIQEGLLIVLTYELSSTVPTSLLVSTECSIFITANNGKSEVCVQDLGMGHLLLSTRPTHEMFGGVDKQHLQILFTKVLDRIPSTIYVFVELEGQQIWRGSRADRVFPKATAASKPKVFQHSVLHDLRSWHYIPHGAFCRHQLLSLMDPPRRDYVQLYPRILDIQSLLQVILILTVYWMLVEFSRWKFKLRMASSYGLVLISVAHSQSCLSTYCCRQHLLSSYNQVVHGVKVKLQTPTLQHGSVSSVEMVFASVEWLVLPELLHTPFRKSGSATTVDTTKGLVGKGGDMLKLTWTGFMLLFLILISTDEQGDVYPFRFRFLYSLWFPAIYGRPITTIFLRQLSWNLSTTCDILGTSHFLPALSLVRNTAALTWILQTCAQARGSTGPALLAKDKIFLCHLWNIWYTGCYAELFRRDKEIYDLFVGFLELLMYSIAVYVCLATIQFSLVPSLIVKAYLPAGTLFIQVTENFKAKGEKIYMSSAMTGMKFYCQVHVQQLQRASSTASNGILVAAAVPRSATEITHKPGSDTDPTGEFLVSPSKVLDSQIASRKGQQVQQVLAHQSNSTAAEATREDTAYIQAHSLQQSLRTRISKGGGIVICLAYAKAHDSLLGLLLFSLFGLSSLL